MQAGGWKCEQRVAGFDGFSIEDLFSLNDADNKARKIVFAGRIEAGHFRGFAANQSAAGFAARAAHAFDELLDHRRIEFPHGEVVEKEKRRRALNKNVVYAMIDEIAAHGGVHAHGHGDFEFRADTVGARNKNRLFPLFVVEGEERAETADTAE